MNGRSTYLDVKVIADVKMKWNRKLCVVWYCVYPKGPESRRGPNHPKMVSWERPLNAGGHSVKAGKI